MSNQTDGCLERFSDSVLMEIQFILGQEPLIVRVNHVIEDFFERPLRNP
jgi:hypothetical protein